MKRYCFSVDDNIRFLKELTEHGYDSIFEHPYLAVYKRLHDMLGLKIQLNLFYSSADFDLSVMTEAYRRQFAQCAAWLKMSFHSRCENFRPYEHSGYDEVYGDCRAVNEQILRFAGEQSLARTTTVHYCLATGEGVKAIKDNGVHGLLGLYGVGGSPLNSYSTPDGAALAAKAGEVIYRDGMAFAGMDVILNTLDGDGIIAELAARTGRDIIKVMIHEQYFYPDYPAYQPDFEEKLERTFVFLRDNGYESAFLEDVI